MPGPRRLVDWPWVVVAVECEPCRYHAIYRLARLAEKYGAEAALADLLERVRAKCRLIDRGHGRKRQPPMACAIRYRVPEGGPMPDGAAAREARPSDPWPPRPRRLGPAGPLPTIGGARREGVTHIDLHCYGLRDGVTCHNTARVALDALGLPDEAAFLDIPRLRRLVCRKCGHERPSAMPIWPSPSEAQARRGSGGASPMREVNGILVSMYPDPPARPEPPAVPSMPELSAYEVVEDDDGTYAVVHAGTGAVARLDGVPQAGLDVERADAAANVLETEARMAAERNDRLDG